MKRALSAGAKKPLVSLPLGPFKQYNDFNVDAAAVLGALEAIYVPLEIREDVPDRKRKVCTYTTQRSYFLLSLLKKGSPYLSIHIAQSFLLITNIK